MTGSYEPTKSTRRNSDARETGSPSGRPETRGGSFKATFTTDGSGDWSITLPPDIDEHDFKALGPVIAGMKTFLEPTVPINLVPTNLEEPADMPDLIA